VLCSTSQTGVGLGEAVLKRSEERAEAIYLPVDIAVNSAINL